MLNLLKTNLLSLESEFEALALLSSQDLNNIGIISHTTKDAFVHLIDKFIAKFLAVGIEVEKDTYMLYNTSLCAPLYFDEEIYGDFWVSIYIAPKVIIEIGNCVPAQEFDSYRLGVSHLMDILGNPAREVENV